MRRLEPEETRDSATGGALRPREAIGRSVLAVPRLSARFTPRSIVLGVSSALAVVLLVLYFSIPSVPSYEAVRRSYVRSDAALCDRHHRLIQELRVDSRVRRLDWMTLDGISPALLAAVVAAEDRRFYQHYGIDWAAVASALAGRFGKGGRRGASTITMQLAAKLRPELEPDSGRRSSLQKVRQMAAALVLEHRWSKRQILEGYLNLVTFRGELQGVDAAARGLFDKAPHGLDSLDAVILASLLRSPNADAAAVQARAEQLSRSMDLPVEAGFLLTRVPEVLSRPYVIRPEASLAPHVARRLLRSGASQKAVVATLDGSLQEYALQVLRHHLASVRNRNVSDGAVLVVDNASGDVLAYVGNQGKDSSAYDIDGVQATRQAGSTLKPFIYARAFEERLLTPASLLEDSPLDVPVPGGIYRPKNYDNRFHGTVNVRTALGSSMNVPAVRALSLVGVAPIVGLFRQMEFRHIQEPEYYGPSLALGSIDVALWDLVGAYRTLAHDGVWSPLRLTLSDSAAPTRTVFSPAAAYLVSDILSDRESRHSTFSLESPLSTRFWTAVKTGTSKDMRDNWCIGYSSRYTVGVWAGNFSGAPMWDVSGITGAAPVWVEIMTWLHRAEPSRAPQAPTDIAWATPPSASMGNRQQPFISGTESAAALPAYRSPRIIYPADGTIIALDPDVPRGQQRLFFQAESADSDLNFVVDGKLIGRADGLRLWVPVRGKHRLELVGASGRVLDAVEFEIRGYPGAPQER